MHGKSVLCSVVLPLYVEVHLYRYSITEALDPVHSGEVDWVTAFARKKEQEERLGQAKVINVMYTDITNSDYSLSVSLCFCLPPSRSLCLSVSLCFSLSPKLFICLHLHPPPTPKPSSLSVSLMSGTGYSLSLSISHACCLHPLSLSVSLRFSLSVSFCLSSPCPLLITALSFSLPPPSAFCICYYSVMASTCLLFIHQYFLHCK